LRSDFNEFVPKNDNSCWIDLNQDLQLIIDKSKLLIESYFIPQLDNLTSRIKILEQWNLNGNAIGLPPRGRLSIAILYWYLNKKDLANDLIESELFDNKGKPYYDYVIDKRNELKKTRHNN
jgi:hypothetical protein